MKMKLTAALVAVAMTFTSAAALAANKTEIENKQPQYSGEYNAFDEIAGFIAENYIDESIPKEQITAQGLSGLLEGNEELLIELLKATLESMDDYSEFYTAEEYKAFQDDFEKTFYGIGVQLRQASDGFVEITGFAGENGQAEKAGFKIGDKIYAVNGENVTGWGFNKVREKIIGEENTTVKITVLRGEEKHDLTAKRVAVHENTVSGGILEGNIGYVSISSFNTGTVKEFDDVLDFMRESGVKNIILNLRNNGGGLVSAATEIAKRIVPKGKIIDVKYRDSKYDVTYNTSLDKKEFDFIVLVNENTASAAEILASALQDSGAGKLLGTETYGKAVIQNMYPLTNGSVIKLTVGEYITRNGSKINHVGLTPDIIVENTTAPLDTDGYTSFDFKTRVSLGNSNDNVKAAKERLKVLGFFSGDTESAVFDAELLDAVKSFQQANSLHSYGILDIATQVLINKVFSKIEVTTDEQLEEAYARFGGNSEKLYQTER